MKNLMLALVALAGVSIVITALAQNQPTTKQTIENLLTRQIVLPQLRNAGTVEAFQSVLILAKVSGGVVISSCDTPVRRDFAVPHTISLETFLKNIEETDTEYKWELVNGALNLLPRTETSDLLNLPIKEFKAKNVTAYEALSLLLAKEEVQKKITELGLNKAFNSIHKSNAYLPESEQIDKRQFDMNLKEVTVRQILNEIAKAKGRKTWIYVEKHCADKKQFSIYFVE